ncbi:MAG: DNA mismatch repair endonuclease MutL [Bacillales bacterium]|jgi:DNA mismatch repair protein MutL|nr:DNA mismatch repair endonuclease MutL [Bacillales bacterium]
MIKVLSNALANLIAAGEVVEGPNSIIKELVENSIDANSTKIDIIMSPQYLQVIDNGDGMDRDDASLAFVRHATSKISKPRDLFNINTLGFRGEALPAIAAVSKVELTTSTGEREGINIIISNSVQLENNKAPLRKGTMVKVSELFYQVPARLKHLDTFQKEFYRVFDVITNLAYGHPFIAFTLYNQNDIVFQTSGNGKIIDIFATLNTTSSAKQMIEIDNSSDDFHISGFVSPISISRANRFGMVILLNGRFIYAPYVLNSIVKAYQTYIPKERFPYCVLNIETDPGLVDVNIHPSKQQVKISKSEQLLDLLMKSIKKVLQSTWQVPNIDTSLVDKHEILQEQPLFYDTLLEDVTEKTDIEKDLYFKVIGQHLGTYIVAEFDDGLYLLDQHAVQERINYEKFSKIFSNKIELSDLLVPLVVTLAPKELLTAIENIEKLKQVGVMIEIFGSNSIKISQIPYLARDINVLVYFNDILEHISHNSAISINDLQEHALRSMACKASIKANYALNIETMTQLIKQLLQCANPFTCPHGRPTMIKFTHLDLEKLFKRVK